MKLIGIGGTNGSGKDTVGQMLAERHGWLFVSVSDFLREEAKKRGLPLEREVLRSISAEWRRKYSLDKAVKLFKESDKKYKGLAVVPMRNPGEAQKVKDLGGVLVWVDADPKLRYSRVQARLRSTEDHKTYQQFLDEEQAEIEHHGGDPATLSNYKVKAMSDIFLENNGNDIEAFKDAAEKALKNSGIAL
ncbi:AAA family ATPase [Candidatus Saccharibacteria bacterium]|nr:AAA family ATPase [Candidatus Saccharibacteria bacterium]